MRQSLQKSASPGRVTAIVSGYRRLALSAVVFPIRYRCPVLRIPAKGFDAAMSAIEMVNVLPQLA